MAVGCAPQYSHFCDLVEGQRLHSKDVRCLDVFRHLCLLSIGEIGWNVRISNVLLDTSFLFALYQCPFFPSSYGAEEPTWKSTDDLTLE